MMDSNTRQVFHTQGFEYPQRPAALTAAINEKAESDSHLPRFFSVSHIQRLSERVAEKAIREEIFRNLPRREDLAAANPINISNNVATTVGAEQRRLQDAVDTGDISTIIARYPVRETPVLTQIAEKLGFQNREQYEGAVRKLLIDEAEALDSVKTFFNPLPADIAAV